MLLMVKSRLSGGIITLIVFTLLGQAYAQEVGTPSGQALRVDQQLMRPDLSVASTSGPTVAVLAYCTDLTDIFGAQNTVNTLVADGRFGTVTLIDGDEAQPTAQDLLDKFDAVIAMTDNRCGVPIPQGIADAAANALTGFAQGGGGVVISTFGFSHLPSGGIGFGASIFGPGLSPLQQAEPGENADAGAIEITDASTTPPCDQLLAGVTSPVSSSWANHVSLSSGATLCVSYENGHPLLAINAANNIVGLNTFPADEFDTTQVAYRRLVSNAVFTAATHREMLVVNNFVTFEPIPSTFTFTPDTTGCPSGFVGTFSFDAKLTNVSASSLSHLVVEVIELTSGNLLQNADGGPGGVGAQLTVPQQDEFSDGVLSPDEFVDVPFIMCLRQRRPFQFMVDALGVVDADTDAQARAQLVR